MHYIPMPQSQWRWRTMRRGPQIGIIYHDLSWTSLNQKYQMEGWNLGSRLDLGIRRSMDSQVSGLVWFEVWKDVQFIWIPTLHKEDYHWDDHAFSGALDTWCMNWIEIVSALGIDSFQWSFSKCWSQRGLKIRFGFDRAHLRWSWHTI